MDIRGILPVTYFFYKDLSNVSGKVLRLKSNRKG